MLMCSVSYRNSFQHKAVVPRTLLVASKEREDLPMWANRHTILECLAKTQVLISFVNVNNILCNQFSFWLNR